MDLASQAEMAVQEAQGQRADKDSPGSQDQLDVMVTLVAQVDQVEMVDQEQLVEKEGQEPLAEMAEMVAQDRQGQLDRLVELVGIDKTIGLNCTTKSFDVTTSFPECTCIITLIILHQTTYRLRLST